VADVIPEDEEEEIEAVVGADAEAVQKVEKLSPKRATARRKPVAAKKPATASRTAKKPARKPAAPPRTTAEPDETEE